MLNLEVTLVLEVLFFYLQEMHPDLTVTDMEAPDHMATTPVPYFQINKYYRTEKFQDVSDTQNLSQ
jgi:hypothetical protein